MAAPIEPVSTHWAGTAQIGQRRPLRQRLAVECAVAQVEREDRCALGEMSLQLSATVIRNLGRHKRGSISGPLQDLPANDGSAALIPVDLLFPAKSFRPDREGDADRLFQPDLDVRDRRLGKWK